jgi:hypothetical protein
MDSILLNALFGFPVITVSTRRYVLQEDGELWNVFDEHELRVVESFDDVIAAYRTALELENAK